MFCSKCGKEISENEKFCHHCGTQIMGTNPVSNQTAKASTNQNTGEYAGVNDVAKKILHMSEDRKIIFLLLTTVVNIMLALSCFSQLIAIRIDDYMTRACSLFSLLTQIDNLSDRYDISIGGIPYILFLIAGGCGIACIVFLIKYMLNLFAGSGGRVLMEYAKGCSEFGIGSLVSVLLGIWYTHIKYNDSFWGMAELDLRRYFWILLIAGVLNIFVFIKGYLGHEIMGVLSPEQEAENARITKSKVCRYCKTTFTIGEVCPNCGRTYHDYLDF